MNRVTGEPERVHPAKEGAQMTFELPETMPCLTPEQMEVWRVPVTVEPDPVHVAARALWELLQETPRHTVDSAPFRERVRALGVALGVEG